jgi:hypothetical protein
MQQPFNYRQQIADPFQQAISSVTEGVRLGTGLRQIQEQRVEAERVKEQRDRLQTEFSKLQQNPTPTWEDYESVAMLLPKDAAESLRKNFEVRSAQEQNQEKLFTGQVAAALSSPNAESRKIGIDRLRRRAEAERNAGRENEARAYEVHARIAETNPAGAKIVADEIITFGSSVFGKDWTESIVRGREAPVQMEKQREEVKKYGADIGLTEAQIKEVQARTKKLSTEQQKAVLELKALQATGGVDPAKKFDQEAKIRGEYQKRTGQYQELKGTFENINSSAAAQTGPGDIALITSFMKMLDPGSVVRETEFATARDTAGLYAQLANNLQKAKDGKFLNPKQRAEYVSLSRQYLNGAERQAKQEENNLRVVVKNYKLNPENIFGAGRESVVVNGVTYERPAGFTDEQWMQYKRSQGAQ